MLIGLILDEQRNQHQSLKPLLYQHYGKEADSAYTLETASQLLKNKIYDYLIIDPNTETLTKALNLLLTLKRDGYIKPFCTIIVISADSSPKFIASCADIVPDDFLLKPTKPAELIGRLSAAIEKKSPLRKPFLDLHRTGRHTETQKQLNAALKTSSTTAQQVQILRALAQISLELKNPAQALEAAKRIRQISSTPHASLIEAEIHISKGSEESAIQLLEETLREHPMLLTGYDMLAEAMYKNGKGEKALQARAKANSISPLNAVRSEKLASEAYDLGDLELAQKTIEFQIQNITDLDPGERLAKLAQIFIDQDKMVEGMDVLASAQKKIGGDFEASPILTLALINSAHEQGKEDDAQRLLDRLILIDETTSGPKKYLADAAVCAYKLGDLEQGDHWLERLLLRQSLSYTQFKRLKSTMVKMGHEARLSQISLKAAKSRAAQHERNEHFKSAGLYSEWAQDMIDLADHPDADIDTMLTALEALIAADEHEQIHQATSLMADTLRQRITELKPNASQETRLLRYISKLNISR